MPTNLPSEYYDIEAEYRAATSPLRKAALIEEMLSVIPKHKGTDHLRADLRRRMSKLKESPQARKASGGRESAFIVDPEGAGQVAVVGGPNVGKSSLVRVLTNATPEVADFPCTTWRPTPGMMMVDNVQIQLIDTPPLTRDYVEPLLFDLLKRTDMFWLMIDLQADAIQQLGEVLSILEAHRIIPERLRIRYQEQRRVFVVPVILLANKCDDQSLDEDCDILCQLLEEHWTLLPVSATTGRNLERLKIITFDRLGIVRVYSKPPGKEPDYTTPFVLKQGDTVLDMAGKVHKDFVQALKAARVWGHGVFDGQLVQRDHILHDGDVVELIT